MNTVAVAGTNDYACNDAYTLAGGALAAGETGLWTLTGGSGTITTATSPTSGLTALGAGINTFTWTVTNASCSSTDIVNITEGSYRYVCIKCLSF